MHAEEERSEDELADVRPQILIFHNLIPRVLSLSSPEVRRDCTRPAQIAASEDVDVRVAPARSNANRVKTTDLDQSAAIEVGDHLPRSDSAEERRAGAHGDGSELSYLEVRAGSDREDGGGDEELGSDELV